MNKNTDGYSIGNWVLHPTMPFAPRQISLTDFYEEYITGQAFFHMKPIPLTEEWLKRMGFKVSFTNGALNNQFYQLDNYTLNKLAGEGNFFGFCEWEDADSQEGYRRLSQIQYVHQLQNLYFALTGTQLLIQKSPA